MRLRFAPSPTGHLHVGGARTAVLNWLVARHHGGAFVLRIEDTDLERNVPGAEAEILDDLRWLGLDWDEGPDVGGPHGPYRQGEAGAIYAEVAERLRAAGAAYLCSCPPAPPTTTAQRRVRCACAELPAARLAGQSVSLRFRVPEGDAVIVHDRIRGEVAFPLVSIEDFVLVRSDGRATYNFAAVVDDARMRISHVIRGADHLLNTPKQVLLYQALHWAVPQFAHIPLILGPDRQKLSKRHGATSVAEHRRLGYMPQALVNYLSLLSWSSPSGEEFLPPERLVREIDLDRLGASDAVFDREKLRWLSGRYLQQLPTKELVARLRPFIDRERFPIPEQVLPVAVEAVRKKLHVLADIGDQLGAFTGRLMPQQERARASAFDDPQMRRVLASVRARLARVESWTETELDSAVRAAGKEAGAQGRSLFLPLRLALTGEEHGSELAKILRVLGREASLALLDPQAVPPHSFDAQGD